MKNVLWVAATAVLVCGIAAQAADTLTLSIQDDAAGTSKTVAAGDQVVLEVLGVLTAGAADNQGLALVGVNLVSTGGAVLGDDALFAAPAGNMEQFVKTAGLTNPAGFGGTASGNDLLQIGGAQNTIGQDGAPPLFPIGTVALTVAHSSTVLAEGTIDTTGWIDGTYEFDISGGFANTLDPAAARGTVYAVTPATVAYVNSKYTLVVKSDIIPPTIVGNWKSLKNHGTAAAANWMGIPVYQIGKPAGEAALGDYRGMETRLNGITQLECTFSEEIKPVLTSQVCMTGCVTGPYYPTSATLDVTGTILTTAWSGIPNGQIVGGPDAYIVIITGVEDLLGNAMVSDNDIEIWAQYGNVKIKPVNPYRLNTDDFDLTDLSLNYTGAVTEQFCMYDIDFTGAVAGSKGKVDDFDYTALTTFYSTMPCAAPPLTCP